MKEVKDLTREKGWPRVTKYDAMYFFTDIRDSRFNYAPVRYFLTIYFLFVLFCCVFYCLFCLFCFVLFCFVLFCFMYSYKKVIILLPCHVGRSSH